MSTTATDNQVYRVLESFSFDLNGRTYVMRRGDLVAGDNPAYVGRESLFEEVNAEDVRRQQVQSSRVSATETAVSVPGQPRATSSPQTPPAPAPTGEPAPEPPPPAPPTPAPTGEPASEAQEPAQPPAKGGRGKAQQG